jgi:hypothetical protein
MPNIDLQLRQEDAKLVFLALAYHLGRPGSELDPDTKQPVEKGLAQVARDLQPQLRSAVAELYLIDDQVKRLQSAMLGSITELKAYSMLELRAGPDGTGRRSTVPGFDRSLLHLFPEIEEDTDNAMAVAESMLLLKRRLDVRLSALPPDDPPPVEEPKRRSWWPFGR